MKTMIATAIALAAERHKDQFDRGGMPYILHCLKVMYYTKSDDQELMCIACLHDIVEDTKTTYEELRELGMSERVIEGIRGLTKVLGETNDEYMDRIKSNRDCIIVKLADLRHNSDIRRLKGITEKDVARIRKYNTMYTELKELL